MSAQLRLFPLPRPLIERLGDDFFKSAPREPGVYIMRGLADRILYVGQSKNLRTRLAYYKNANPDRVPRRLTRLVHEVETITLERCPTAEAARARELELLRIHQPRFNRADTGPRFYHYLDLQTTTSTATIYLHLDPPAHPNDEKRWIGPIRGRTVAFEAFAALHRLTVSAQHQLRRCSELPLVPKRLTSLTIEAPHVVPPLGGFLAGNSIELVTHLLESQSPHAEPPLQLLHQCDAEILLSWARLLQDV
ncbi:MAG TPA: GIY-YIG nuclease family protein [Verrucomicrobiae bacterium]